MSLDIVGAAVLHYRDNSRRWIDVRHFIFPEPATDQDLLARLIASRQFRNGYMGGPDWADPNPIHGPYRLETISPDCYRLIDSSEAAAWLDDFCSLFQAPAHPALAADIESVVRRRLREADSVFQLPELDDAQHDTGWVLHEFRELVLIRRNLAELSLVVMGID